MPTTYRRAKRTYKWMRLISFALVAALVISGAFRYIPR